MADKAMDVYLNDHLAGAMFGSDLAKQIRSQAEGTALGEVMASLASQIDADRLTLIDVMDRMGTSKNPVKQATTWIAEKASRPKFSGRTSGEPELGTFLALESLSLGVEGKGAMWKALKDVSDKHAVLASINLDELIARAEAQRRTLEGERLAAGRRALGDERASEVELPA
jgi:hypothetical protein